RLNPALPQTISHGPSTAGDRVVIEERLVEILAEIVVVAGPLGGADQIVDPIAAAVGQERAGLIECFVGGFVPFEPQPTAGIGGFGGGGGAGGGDGLLD